MTTYLKEHYSNKKILITGNTGFKGSWLSIWLNELGAKVYGLSDKIPTTPSHFEAAKIDQKLKHYFCDIKNKNQVNKIINEIKPDFIFHLAAQPLVRLSYDEPADTLETNFMGTVNVLDALKEQKFDCNAVFITSDKCYDNVEWQWGYRENDALGGKDPYSASKGAAELAIKTYAHSYFSKEESKVKIAVGRAGNVIGGGDWALDRIIPDCMKSWSEGKSVDVRSPQATRPWQHVLEPLSGYLVLGAELSQRPKLNSEPYNFGPPANQNKTVESLINQMAKHWDQISWNDVSQKTDHVHEAGLLKLCCDKALHQLNWEPTLNFEQTVQYTVDWYRQFYETPDKDIYALSLKQIKDYTVEAEKKGLSWTR